IGIHPVRLRMRCRRRHDRSVCSDSGGAVRCLAGIHRGAPVLDVVDAPRAWSGARRDDLAMAEHAVADQPDLKAGRSILFLYATQAEPSRRRVYPEACRELARAFGHRVVFCYSGPPMPGLDGLAVEHFETWAAAHRGRIASTPLIEIEQAFPRSHF